MVADGACGGVAYLCVVALLRFVFSFDIMDAAANMTLVRSSLVASTVYFTIVFHLMRQLDCFHRPRSRAWIITVACAVPLGISCVNNRT